MRTEPEIPSRDSRVSTAVGRAFAVLRVLRRAQAPLTLTAIAAETGLAPSSAHSVLTQLLAQGAVLQASDKRYALGPAVFYAGSAYARGARVFRSVWLELVSAANHMRVTTAIAVPWEGHHLILAAHRAGEFDVGVPSGGRVPLDGGSWGKVYYGWSGAEVPSRLVQYTAASITDPEEFAGELRRTHSRGYATDNGEFSDGIAAVCSPVTSTYGYEGLASFLATVDSVDALGIDALGRRLSALTARASFALGDRGRLSYFGRD